MTITSKLQEILEFCYRHKIKFDLVNEGDVNEFDILDENNELSVHIKIKKKADKDLDEFLNKNFKKLKNRFN
jgi:hypothetical protein